MIAPRWGAAPISPDLVNWTRQLDHDDNPPLTGPTARWRRRHTFGSCVFDGYLWVVGGDHLDGSFAPSDVWRSSDGVTWDEIERGIRIEDFRIDNIVARVSKLGDLWKPVLGKKRFDLYKILK